MGAWGGGLRVIFLDCGVLLCFLLSRISCWVPIVRCWDAGMLGCWDAGMLGCWDRWDVIRGLEMKVLCLSYDAVLGRGRERITDL